MKSEAPSQGTATPGKKERAIVAFVAIILVVAIGAAAYSLQPRAAAPAQTTQSLQSAFSSTTTAVNYGCTILGQSVQQGSESSAASSQSSIPDYTSAIVDVNTTEGSIQLNMSASPMTSFSNALCSYTYSQTSFPVYCGAACGGGIYYLTAQEYLLQLNFSLGPQINAAGYNLTIYAEEGQLSSLMPIPNDGVTIDSSPVPWYSTPPCAGEEGAEGCLSPVASSMTVQLPPIENGIYLLMLNSSETSTS